ncbi:deoxyribonuclease IV [Proteiniclasticum sp. SCR006]|uniref:Probable endonuclease 4 n=1 Tax=Proteiniclasticum aestuarii TaxID=2817862 RepID=A0A939KKJ6_9CLOT|nr:deoxyribonuclease IV [Proteiniclasticum aestuarii]MBO1266278.1 deoxyribonuclease IV [Proteiniclasticum aestuarii]
MKIGSHVSIKDGLLGAAKESHSYGSSTFMIYTGAPQNTRRSPIENMKIEEGQKYMEAHGLTDFVVHAPYIINLASYKPEIFNLATDFLKVELDRTTALGSEYLVLHPGAFTDKDAEYGMKRIAEGLNMVLEDGTRPFVCLETMAGKGTEIGRSFEELAAIIKMVDHKDKIGICFDTCHTHDSGYDIIHDFDGVIREFDSIIGLDRLKVIHVNGSLNPRGAKKDRHANIGATEDNPRGRDQIGADALKYIVHHEAVKNRPIILETPWLDKKTNLYKEEIAFLRGDSNL